MKCVNCGYELAKPNIKKCPLCGHRVNQEEVSSEDGRASSGQAPVEAGSAEETITGGPALREVKQPRDTETESVETSPVSTEETLRQEKVVYPENPPAPDSTPHPASMGEDLDGMKVSDARHVDHSTLGGKIPEDPDQYLENGSYQPYPDEVEGDADHTGEPIRPTGGQSATWVVSIAAAIAGLLLGVFLYLIIK